MTEDPEPARSRAWLPAAAYVAVWLVLSTVAAVVLFLGSERTVEVASHEATISPDLSGQVVIRSGPVLPAVRVDSGYPVGLEIELGQTSTSSVDTLIQRYAAIGSQPEPQIDKVRDTVRDLAVDAALRGAAVGALPVLVWLLIGPRRREELVARLPTRRGVIGLVATALVVVGLTTPWRGLGPGGSPVEGDWVSLTAFVGPSVPLPEDLQEVEVQGGGTTAETRRLLESAINSYREGQEFYRRLADAAGDLELRRPADDETVAVLVSDRHDNVGMDPVALAIAEAGGASYVLDAGDDTSTGNSWEAFSLDSLAQTFEDFEGRWAVTGNHDHGGFVREYLSDRDWTYFDGEVVDGPGDSRILGVDDPRSSGLGDWRDQTGLTFEEVRARLADAACEADDDGDRVGTLLVHDANLGQAALERGCVDLVVGGHTHVTDGPTRVDGENGETGYRFTVGTAGGAAYAIAVGSKIRRPAAFALITYRDDRPVGLQHVTIQTTGRLDLSPYIQLTY